MPEPRSRRLTDDEMEERARRNLEGHQETLVRREASVHVEDVDDPLSAELDGLILRIGSDDDVVTAEELRAVEQLDDEDRRAAVMRVVRAAKEKYSPGGPLWQENYTRIAAQSAAEKRKEYRARILAEEDRPVLGYRQGLDSPTEEARKVEKAEYDRQRYAKLKGEPVQPRIKLNELSPKARAARKRAQAQQRQARRRRNNDQVE